MIKYNSGIECIVVRSLPPKCFCSKSRPRFQITYKI